LFPVSEQKQQAHPISMFVSKLFVLVVTVASVAATDSPFRRLNRRQCVADTGILFTDNPPLASAAGAWTTAWATNAENCLDVPSIVTGECTIDAGDGVTDAYDDACVNAANGDFAPGVFEELDPLLHHLH